MGNNLLIITAIGAVFSAIISLINIYYTKRRILSETFSQIRHQRIKETRDAVGNFITSYFEEAHLEPDDRKKVKQAILKTELYFEFSVEEYFNTLKKILHRYRDTVGVITDHEELIKETQKLLDLLLNRAKLDVGLTPRIDKRQRKKAWSEILKHDNTCIPARG